MNNYKLIIKDFILTNIEYNIIAHIAALVAGFVFTVILSDVFKKKENWYEKITSDFIN